MSQQVQSQKLVLVSTEKKKHLEAVWLVITCYFFIFFTAVFQSA